MNRADEAAWREYVAVEVGKFFDHCEGTTYIWAPGPESERVIARLTGERRTVRYTDEAGRERTRFEYVGGDSELAAFSGPWHVIRKHLTTEFRQWVQEYEGTRRLTPSEWRAARAAERADVAYMDSADYSLGQLAELRRLTAERDALIVESARRGASKTAIARTIGLSRQQIHTIVAAADAADAATIAPVTPIGTAAPVTDDATEWRQTADGEWHEVF